jgi:HEAT repeat protein
MSFAPFSPTEAEAIALRDLDNDFEYTRMAALNVLHLLQSPHLPNALERLGDDPNDYVRSYVNELVAYKTGG